MKTAYLILLLALVGWKGYYAWLRGRRQWSQDMQQYQSLWEYLLGNGATLREARKPFIRRALSRAFAPMMKQWRLWAIVAVIGILIWIIF
jgi:ABC-type iron transport system FetAB permease component